MMQIIFEGVDISQDVDVNKCIAHDGAGSEADSITISFADLSGLWSKWNPQRGNSLRVKEGNYDSGHMYVDQIIKQAGRFIVEGISIPLQARVNKTKRWQNITFLSIARELAASYGLNLKAINVPDHPYETLTQFGMTDLGFLNRMCIRESCMLKIFDRTVVIYHEPTLEKGIPVLAFYNDQMADKEFVKKTEGIYSGCTIQYLNLSCKHLTGIFKDPGLSMFPELKINEKVNNIDEASRWARGYLRTSNKYQYSGWFDTRLEAGIAAGCLISVPEYMSTACVVNEITYDIVNKKSTITLRGIVGDY